MTREEFAEYQEKLLDELLLLREQGQKEYAHSDNNAFRNFETLAEETEGMDPGDRKTVLWIYVRKHIDGVLAYLRGHKSQRESVHGRIKDIIVYFTLLDAMIQEEETANDLPF